MCSIFAGILDNFGKSYENRLNSNLNQYSKLNLGLNAQPIVLFLNRLYGIKYKSLEEVSMNYVHVPFNFQYTLHHITYSSREIGRLVETYDRYTLEERSWNF